MEQIKLIVRQAPAQLSSVTQTIDAIQALIGKIVPIELTNIDLVIGKNTIAHQLGRKVSILTSFQNGQRIDLDWSALNTDTNANSITEIYIYSNSVYSGLTINIF